MDSNIDTSLKISCRDCTLIYIYYFALSDMLAKKTLEIEKSQSY